MVLVYQQKAGILPSMKNYSMSCNLDELMIMFIIYLLLVFYLSSNVHQKLIISSKQKTVRIKSSSKFIKTPLDNQYIKYFDEQMMRPIILNISYITPFLIKMPIFLVKYFLRICE